MAPESAKAGVCNGCGPQGFKVDIVPDNILGVDISEACNIHDWMYNEAAASRYECDLVFKRNMRTLVDTHGRGPLLYWRRVLVWWYWRGVHRLGAPAYKG
jgi:hypothetical protein